MAILPTRENVISTEVLGAREQNRLLCSRLRSGWFPHTVANGHAAMATCGLAITTTTLAANSISFTPIIVPEMFVENVLIEVTTLAASSSASVGIYYNNPNGSLVPDRLFWQSASASTGSTGIKTFPCNMWLSKGLWWQAIVTGNTSATFRGLNTGAIFPTFGTSTSMGGSYNTAITMTGTNNVGNLPSYFPRIISGVVNPSFSLPVILFTSNAYNRV